MAAILNFEGNQGDQILEERPPSPPAQRMGAEEERAGSPPPPRPAHGPARSEHFLP